MKNLILIVISFIVLFSSCKKEDSIPAGKYDNGLIFLNEGAFGNGAGSISFWDRNTKTTITDIYANENNGAKLGNILQSMTQVGDELYFVVNNSNRIVITDKNFKYKSQIDSLELPRYMVVYNGKAYVSQWGKDGLSGSLAIIDLNTRTIIKKIALGKGPENLLLDGDYLYVSMVGGYDKDNRIFKVNLSNESVSTIEVPDNPSQLIKLNNAIWVLCKGYFDYINPLNSTKGYILKIEGDVISKSYDLNSQAESMVLTPDNKYFYYLDGGYPFVFDIATSSSKTISGISKYIYKLGYDNISKRVLLSDPLDYSSNGKVYFMNDQFQLVDSTNAGIIPTAFYQIQ